MPMLHSHDLDFSYSGLKTAVLYAVKKLGALTDQQRADIARAFEDAAIGILIEKTRLALESYEAKTLIVGGGVSANSYLKQGLEQLLKSFPAVSLRFPDHSLTTDNAVMIGIAAYIDTLTGNKPSTDIKASGNLSY
jgi:N6-L-threonylcarbamoyladenine synthase